MFFSVFSVYKSQYIAYDRNKIVAENSSTCDNFIIIIIGAIRGFSLHFATVNCQLKTLAKRFCHAVR